MSWDYPTRLNFTANIFSRKVSNNDMRCSITRFQYIDESSKDGIPVIPDKYLTEIVQMEDIFLKSKDPKVERKLRKRVNIATFSLGD